MKQLEHIRAFLCAALEELYVDVDAFFVLHLVAIVFGPLLSFFIVHLPFGVFEVALVAYEEEQTVLVVLARLSAVLLLELIEPLADLLEALTASDVIDNECNGYSRVIGSDERSIYFLPSSVPQEHLDGAFARHLF